jgi:hypothetical protein
MSRLLQMAAEMTRLEFAGAIAQGQARAEAIEARAQQIAGQPCVVVHDTIASARGGRIACGSSSFSRATVRVDACGVLYVTRCDDQIVTRIYPAGHWTEATQYLPRAVEGPLDVDFYLTPQQCLGCGEPVGEADTYCTVECSVSAECAR